jgi:hypothetical protein
LVKLLVPNSRTSSRGASENPPFVCMDSVSFRGRFSCEKLSTNSSSADGAPLSRLRKVPAKKYPEVSDAIAKGGPSRTLDKPPKKEFSVEKRLPSGSLQAPAKSSPKALIRAPAKCGRPSRRLPLKLP